MDVVDHHSSGSPIGPMDALLLLLVLRML